MTFGEKVSFRIEMFLYEVIVPVFFPDCGIAEIRHFHGDPAQHLTADGHDPGEGHIARCVDIPRCFFAGENFPCEVIEFPEVAAAVAHGIGEFAQFGPFGFDFVAFAVSGGSEIDLFFCFGEIKCAFTSPDPSGVSVVAGRPHQVPHDPAVFHLYYGKTGAARQNTARLFYGDRGRRNFHGAQTGDLHNGTERVGIVIMAVQPGAPVMQFPTVFQRGAVHISVLEGTAVMVIIIFGIDKFPEQTVLPQLPGKHIFLCERIIFQQIVNFSALFHGFDQADAIRRLHEGCDFAHHMFSGVQCLDAVFHMGGEECRHQNGIDIHAQEFIFVVRYEHIRIMF